MCGNTYNEKKIFELNEYWEECGNWYELNTTISLNDFAEFPMKNGFNKGDIIVLIGKKPEDIGTGDIIVFRSNRPDPIIHRVVDVRTSNGKFVFQTKGDNNKESLKGVIDETNINQDQVIGKSLFKIPYLGFIKIWFVEILRFVIK